MKANLAMHAGFLSVALLLVAAPMPAQQPGQTADQLNDLGNRARKAGDLPGAASWLCQAAAQDAKYAKRCDKAKVDLENTLAQYQADLNMGRSELVRKDFGGALRDLRKITFGPGKEEALDLIQQARVGSGEISPEQASRVALEAARSAYAEGAFDKAEALLQHVQTPGTRDAANQLLTNMRVYRDTMREADGLARNGDDKGAALKYGFAAVVQPKGPGQPQEHQRAAEAAAKAEAAKAQPPAPLEAEAAPPPAKGNDLGKIKGFLAAARRLELQGNRKGALAAYQAALKLDGRQKDALSGSKRMLAGRDTDPKALEDSLARGIVDFYASRFTEANEGIGVYLQGGGRKHTGAAHFFLGASFLSEVILGDLGDRADADALQTRAQQEFALARQLGYAPPEADVSPKILAQWSQAGAPQ